MIIHGHFNFMGLPKINELFTNEIFDDERILSKNNKKVIFLNYFFRNKKILFFRGNSIFDRNPSH